MEVILVADITSDCSPKRLIRSQEGLRSAPDVGRVQVDRYLRVMLRSTNWSPEYILNCKNIRPTTAVEPLIISQRLRLPSPMPWRTLHCYYNEHG